MGKKAAVKGNNIEAKPRAARDFYATPRKAVEPLIRHLPEYGTFCEPCAGNAALATHVDYLTFSGFWPRRMFDIEPQDDRVVQKDALTLTCSDVVGCDYILTNPPFEWKLLKGMLDLFPTLKPTWLLLPFAYAANLRMTPYMGICRKVQPIGRVKWFEDSKQSSTDDFAWYLFDSDYVGTTKLYSRE